mgnify:CR=1 FL=1
MQNKKTYVIFFATLLGLLLIVGGYLWVNTKKITYVIDDAGWEELCWEGNCAWSNQTSPELVERFGTKPPTLITRTVNKITHSEEIISYLSLRKQYSPLKSFAIGENKIAFNLLDKYPRSKNILRKPLVYVYDKVSAKLSSYTLPGDDFYVQAVTENGISLVRIVSDKDETEFYLLNQNGELSLSQTVQQANRITDATKEGWKVYNGYRYTFEYPEEWSHDGAYLNRDTGMPLGFNYVQKTAISAEDITPGKTTSVSSIKKVEYKGSYNGLDLYIVENFQVVAEKTSTSPTPTPSPTDDYPTTGYLLSENKALIIDGLGREIDPIEAEILKSVTFTEVK